MLQARRERTQTAAMKLLLVLAAAVASIYSAAAFCVPTARVSSFQGAAVATRDVVAAEGGLQMMVSTSLAPELRAASLH